MNYKAVFLTTFALLLFSGTTIGQELDDSFVMPQLVRQADINSMVWMDDGKILVGGRIDFYEESKVSHLIRLNADGTLDETFVGSSESVIKEIQLLPTDEIIVGTSTQAMKLSADGELINSLDLEEGEVLQHIVSGDDFLLIEVEFDYGPHIIKKYTNDLELDDEFDPIVVEGHLYDIELHQGKILLAGWLLKLDGESIVQVVRFNMDGTLDDTFNLDVETDPSWGEFENIPFKEIYVTSTDEIYIQTRAFNGFLKLNADGSNTEFVFDDDNFRFDIIDASFLDESNNIYVIGNCNYYGNNDSYGRRIVKYDADGQLVEDFQLLALTEKNLKNPTIVVNPSGEVLFGNINNLQNRYGINKLLANGLVDTGFTPEVGTYGTIDVAGISGDRFVVAGDFNRLNDYVSNDIAILNLDGSVDESFVYEGLLERTPTDIDFHDGNIFLANGLEVFKFLADGSLDETFNTQPEFLSVGGFPIVWFCENIHVQEDGKIVTTSPNGVFRMDEEGDPDYTYGPYFPSPTVTTAFNSDMDKDDRVIFGANFDQLGSGVFSDLARINPDGTFDESFQVVPDDTHEFGPGITAITSLTNGETMVFGYFNRFSNFAANRNMVKLDKDGKVDERFLQFVNTTFTAQASGLENYTSFRGGFVVAGYDSYYIVNEEFIFNYQLHVFNNSGIYQTKFELPEDYQASSTIIPLIINNNDVILISKFLKEDEEPFHAIRLKVNNLPTIIDHVENVALEAEGFDLSFDHLEVEDTDNVYPDDFEINIYRGDNFTISGNKIIPKEGFSGVIEVPVTVTEGNNESNFVLIQMSVEAPLSTEDEGEVIEMYPNPTTDVVNVSTNQYQNVEIQDLAGNIIKSEIQNGQINLSGYSSGVYIIRLTDTNGNSISRKIIKE